VTRRRRRVAILGASGSIGTQALDVIARHADRFEVVGLAVGSQVAALLEQARRFAPRVVSCAQPDDARALAESLPAGIRVASGADGLRAVAAESDADVVLAATDGAVAFDAVFAAAERGIALAVANKELIVAAGELLFAAAKASGAAVLPVDSEHSALFQCLVGEPRERVATLVLTASGGPFWDLDQESMGQVSVADALRHPTWNMGTKNTVDSATMMNKGLEVIEASRFFGVPPDQIEVLVHRTSLAHGFVIFTDGNIKGQLARPDMRLPIGYALAYPDRLAEIDRADPFSALGGKPGEPALTLTFERPDLARFPCLGLAYEALRRGGTAPAALSAANEVAVRAFVEGRLGFGAIADVVGGVLRAGFDEPLTLAAVRTADARARVLAERAVAECDNGRAGAVYPGANSSAGVEETYRRR
jgi:1-deoxy-D-xylulose-5-phosphate reductoisomerase